MAWSWWTKLKSMFSNWSERPIGDTDNAEQEVPGKGAEPFDPSAIPVTVPNSVIKMTKKDIEEYCKQRYGTDLDRRKTKENMLEELTKVQIEHFARAHYNIELDRRQTRENMVSELISKVQSTHFIQ